MFRSKKSKAIKKEEKKPEKKADASKKNSKEINFQKAIEMADKNSKGPRRYTEDGYRIYTMEELGLGEGGDGPDCPFDCNCCF